MADAYSPSDLGGTTLNTMPARVATPTPPAPATATTYAPSPLPSYSPAQISHAIISNESGGRNVVSPQGARGPGQIMPGTFKQWALPGENIDNPADNMRVHDRIIAAYSARWPNDPARVAVAYFSGPGNVSPPGSPNPWISNRGDVNESVAKYVANVQGKLGQPGAATPAPSTVAQPSPAPISVGNALAGLSTPTGTGRSTMQNLEGMTPDTSQPAPAYSGLENQQAAAMMGNARQQQIAGQAAQLAAAWRAQSAKPLTWSSTPFGSGAAGQAPPPVPGATLNSTGGLYG